MFGAVAATLKTLKFGREIRPTSWPAGTRIWLHTWSAALLARASASASCWPISIHKHRHSPDAVFPFTPHVQQHISRVRQSRISSHLLFQTQIHPHQSRCLSQLRKLTSPLPVPISDELVTAISSRSFLPSFSHLLVFSLREVATQTSLSTSFWPSWVISQVSFTHCMSPASSILLPD